MQRNNRIKRCKNGILHLIKIPVRHARSVERSALDALEQAGKLLQYKKPAEVVVFSATPESVIPELGIGAHALSQGDIVVNIDFARKDIRKIIQKELPSTLFHEYSHVVRGSVFKDPYATLFDALVTEGIASYLEKSVIKNNVPYIKLIRGENRFWLKAKKILRKKNYTWDTHREWFFGGGKLPRWIAYRLGYLIISSFMMNHRDTSMAKLTRMKAEDILLGSGYSKSQQAP